MSGVYTPEKLVYGEEKGTQNFCKAIDEAIEDETNAPIMYSNLIALANKAADEDVFIDSALPVIEGQIEYIKSQERKHKETLEGIKRAFCEV